MNHLEIGAIGEEITLSFLKKKGYSYIERNYLKKFGEIDLIMKKDKIIYFIEVKTMSGSFDRDRLIEKIHKRKISRLKNAIFVYRSENEWIKKMDWRLGAALVSLDQKFKKAEVEFIENLF